MNLPVIGISGDLALFRFFSDFWIKRSGVNHDYVQSVTRSCGLPIILPVTDTKSVSQLVSKIDGLILTGGNDVSPLLYGEDALSGVGELNPERDYFELSLLREAIAQNKPILAICRGAQLLNIAFGGTLYQDVSYDKSVVQQHLQKTDPIIPIHGIKIKKDSILHSILGDEFMVNSLHHQTIKDLSPEFNAVAWSKDGVIEAIEKTGDNFAIGIQWHPEIMSHNNAKMQNVFDLLIKEASKGLK